MSDDMSYRSHTAKRFFIGIDSDGCVFDTMEAKQKRFFTPNTIRFFGLEKIEDLLRQTAEFVNLYSRRRGQNRFLALEQTFDLLAARPEFKESGVELPVMETFRAWTRDTGGLGNVALAERVEAANDPFLSRVLEWSLKINEEIAREFESGGAVFRWARESMERAAEFADLAVVSQTPVEALEREWEISGLRELPGDIFGQEHGVKAEHLRLATRAGLYEDGHKLMVGDALGDMIAANHAGTLFYPVVPGDEEASWKEFLGEGLDRFRNGGFAGSYESERKAVFLDSLPEHPSWVL